MTFQKFSGREWLILHLRGLLSFLVSSSVNDWWLLLPLGKIQFHVTLCKWLFQNIPDCPGSKMMCPNILLGAMLQTLLKYSVEIQAVWMDSGTSYSKITLILKLLILNASDLGATIQVSLKYSWLMCHYLVKLLNSSLLRMIIYQLQNIDILFGRRGSGW